MIWVKLDKAIEWKGKSHQFWKWKRLQCEGLVLGWDTTEQWKFLPDLEEQPFLEGWDPDSDAFFLHGNYGNEIQWDNEHWQMQQQRSVCGERSLHRTWRTHGPRGGRVWEAVHKTRFTCIHILHLLQIISSVASGPGWHAWQGAAVNTITFDICWTGRSWK